MSRDLRRYARQTNFRLILGGLAILYLVGGSLIYVIYGAQAALLGVLCLTAGLAPIGLIILLLGVMEWIVKRSGQG
jgi:hypothetical protein